MRTGQVGEWSANQNQASGITQKTAPDSRRNILAQWERQRARFYCTICETTQTVRSVSSIKQLSESAEYQATLTCGHDREIVLSVQRTPSGKAKRGYISKDEIPTIDSEKEMDPQEFERLQIKRAWKETGLS